MGRGRKRSRDSKTDTCECAGGRSRDDKEAEPAGSPHQQASVLGKEESEAKSRLGDQNRELHF